MINTIILERNLLALAAKNPPLCKSLQDAEPSERLKVENARNGNPVPVLISGDGRSFPLHSLVDPVREAERIRSANPDPGYCIFLGFGAGYIVREFLKDDRLTKALVIERSLGLMKAILSEIDASDIFSDPRVGFLVDPTEEELGDVLLSTYLPVLSGDLRTIRLRSRVDLDRKTFEESADFVRSTLARLSDDYTVQAYFGKIWFKNTVRNLSRAERNLPPLPPSRSAIVTAAGPSLEDSLPEIRAIRAGHSVIATDTTLPILLGGGITPDIVVSIDCQHISYYHFLSGYPEDVPLVIDLSSPAALTRFTEKTYFFSSGHPLCRYISGHWRAFPQLDTSGGNVTHAAVSLADSLGAKEIRLYGADFSYPFGKSYARGAYIYPYFLIRQGKTNPEENCFFSFLFRNEKIVREVERGVFRYLTKPLVAYRERLEKFSATIDARLIPVRGSGSRIEVVDKRPLAPKPLRLFAAGPARGSARSFLAEYARKIDSLRFPGGQEQTAFERLPLKEKDLWTTLLPAAACLRKSQHEEGSTGRELLEATREYCLSMLSKYI